MRITAEWACGADCHDPAGGPGHQVSHEIPFTAFRDDWERVEKGVRAVATHVRRDILKLLLTEAP